MGYRDDAPGGDQIPHAFWNQAAIRNVVIEAHIVRDVAGSFGIMNINRIRAARNGIRESARVRHVVTRQDIVADNTPRFAHADLGGRRDEIASRKARHLFAKELEQQHHLAAPFDFRFRQIVGVRRIQSDDSTRVHANFARAHSGEKQQLLARNRHMAFFPDGVKTLDAGRIRKLIQNVIARRRIKFTRIFFHVIAHLVHIHAAQAKVHGHGLRCAIRVASLGQFRAGKVCHVRIAGGIHKDFAAQFGAS